MRRQYSTLNSILLANVNAHHNRFSTKPHPTPTGLTAKLHYLLLPHHSNVSILFVVLDVQACIMHSYSAVIIALHSSSRSELANCRSSYIINYDKQCAGMQCYGQVRGFLSHSS